MNDYQQRVNAASLDEVAQDDAVTVFVVVGKVCCGKTHLADALVKLLRDVRSPCFPLFIDEANHQARKVLDAAIQEAMPQRPVVIAVQSYRDISRHVVESVTLGTAIVLAGTQGGMDDAEELSARFGIDISSLRSIPIREFLVLRRTTN